MHFNPALDIAPTCPLFLGTNAASPGLAAHLRTIRTAPSSSIPNGTDVRPRLVVTQIARSPR